MKILRRIRPMTLLPTLLWLGGLACAASHHQTQPADLGRASASHEMLAVIPEPGPIEFNSVKAADWVVARSGLINLDHPKAVAAGLEDGDEAIGIYFHVLRHPRFGTFIVDTGVESGFQDPDGNDRVSFLVESAMRTSDLEIHTTTREWLASQSEPLAGVFLTHLHLDHVMGLPDVPPSTPVYAGPGETDASQFLNLFSRGTIDGMLEGSGPLREWSFDGDPDGRFTAVVDIFGDGSVWAIHVPGHSPGSTAYLVRSSAGPKLLVGDASHTRWGWENGVEPGTFSLDLPRSARSLAVLRELVGEFPQLDVYLGHQ
jgi:N-acyl homoserine lactone hydrolase